MKSIFGILLVMGLSYSALAADNTQDRDIYDALIKVPAFGMPTPYPYAGYDKHVGRLDCQYMINTQTKAETYKCDLFDGLLKCLDYI